MVDTSELVKDERDIFSTKRPACIAEGDQLHNMIINTPTNLPNKNILLRIFEKKTLLPPEMSNVREALESDYCLINRDFPKLFNLFFSPIFLVHPRTTGHYFLITFWSDNILTNEKIWSNQKVIFEYNLVSTRGSLSRITLCTNLYIHFQISLSLWFTRSFTTPFERGATSNDSKERKTKLIKSI